MCDLKPKVALMIPEQNEYNSFGRSTKLLLHPKDVPDLQFSSKTEERGEIPPETEISVVQVVSKQEKLKGTDVCGEILPKSHEVIKTPVIKTCNEYIVEYTEDQKECGKILPKTAAKEESDKLCKKRTWFQNPINCVSKWSKALKMGVVHSIGLDHKHTAVMDSGERDKVSFSFFL